MAQFLASPPMEYTEVASEESVNWEEVLLGPNYWDLGPQEILFISFFGLLIPGIWLAVMIANVVQAVVWAASAAEEAVAEEFATSVALFAGTLIVIIGAVVWILVLVAYALLVGPRLVAWTNRKNWQVSADQGIHVHGQGLYGFTENLAEHVARAIASNPRLEVFTTVLEPLSGRYTAIVEALSSAKNLRALRLWQFNEIADGFALQRSLSALSGSLRAVEIGLQLDRPAVDVEKWEAVMEGIGQLSLLEYVWLPYGNCPSIGEALCGKQHLRNVTIRACSREGVGKLVSLLHETCPRLESVVIDSFERTRSEPFHYV